MKLPRSQKNLDIGITVLALVVTVKAQLNCQVFEGKKVVCTAGDSDFILSRGLVSDNDSFTNITLKNCRIVDIEIDAFQNDYYLRYVDLSENSISNLQPNVLDGSPQLTHLNLSHNWMTALQPGIFLQKPNIQILDLRENQLNLLPEDIFVPLRKLIYMDLSANSIVGKGLSPFMLDKNIKIKHLDLSRNDMSDSPENLLHSLTQLDFLNLDRCSLKEIPQFATKPNLRTMRRLILSINQITALDRVRLQSLENLENLDVSENLIDFIDPNAFISLKKIKSIVLRYNRLKTLQDGLFRNLANLEMVDLSHNLLEYVTFSAFSGTALKTLNLGSNRFSYMDAHFIQSLRNYGVRIVELNFEENPWQCACLNDILIEMKTFGIKYSSAKYNGMHPVCVTTKIFACKRQSLDNQLFLDMYEEAFMKLGPTN